MLSEINDTRAMMWKTTICNFPTESTIIRNDYICGHWFILNPRIRKILQNANTETHQRGLQTIVHLNQLILYGAEMDGCVNVKKKCLRDGGRYEGRKEGRKGERTEWTSHFHKGIRVAVGVHGGQVNTAHHPYEEAAKLSAVHQRDENPTALLHLSIFTRLQTARDR